MTSEEAGVHIYVSGVPGVGKTSLCRSLAARWPDRFVHVEMGRLITEASEVSVDRDEMRAHPNRYVDSFVLGRATQALSDTLGELEKRGLTALVEGRAVVRETFGFMLMPTSEDHFGRIAYRCIVHLCAPPTDIQARISGDPKFRWQATTTQVEVHQDLEFSVSVTHALTHKVPLYCVDASGTAETVIAGTLDVIGGDLN